MNDRDIEDMRQPNDVEEAVFCDSCGEEVEWDFDLDYSKRIPSSCDNPLCPSKHEGITKEMAEKIIELQQERDSLSRKVKYLEWQVGNLLTAKELLPKPT